MPSGAYQHTDLQATITPMPRRELKQRLSESRAKRIFALPNRWSSESHQACLNGRVVTEVGVANVSDFDQRSKISAETSGDGPGELFLSVWSQRQDETNTDHADETDRKMNPHSDHGVGSCDHSSRKYKEKKVFLWYFARFALSLHAEPNVRRL